MCLWLCILPKYPHVLHISPIHARCNALRIDTSIPMMESESTNRELKVCGIERQTVPMLNLEQCQIMKSEVVDHSVLIS